MMANRTTTWIERRRAKPGRSASGGGGLNPWVCRLRACLLACLVVFVAHTPAFAQMSGVSTKARGKGPTIDQIIKVPDFDTTANSDPMLLQADEMVYDNENNRVTAKGNVEIYYGNYTLLAERVVYDRNSNTLTAVGNVRIKDPSGSIITADTMTLTDDFRDGFIDALKVVTRQDTRIVARTAQREAGNVTVFYDGWFTPCKPCENPNKPPTWRIRAGKIIHRKDEATITYRNAFFDFFGVPVIYFPYFQSADPTVKRKSGFLMPWYSQSDRLGSTFRVPYYFALSDHFDFTFVPMFTSEAGVLWQGNWRHRLASGGYSVDLAGVFDDGTREGSLPGDLGFQGSVLSQGKFALNPYWSWGWNVTAEEPDTFRRYYGLSTKLKTDQISTLYMEGLHDRNYASMRFYDTNTLLSTKNPLADAVVYPIVDYDYILGQPILGGELSFNSNLMALRNYDGTDSNRAIAQAQWRRQMVDPLGQVWTPFAQLRGDLYAVNNFVDFDGDTTVDGIDTVTGFETDQDITRGNAVIGAEYRYPWIASTGPVAHILEPVGQIIARPASVGDQGEIPNEDARSLVFDDTLLFDIDKFSGYDRIETGTRANAALRYTAEFPYGGYIRTIFGQSYQLAGENPFGRNTGLATENSDYVGSVYLQASRYLGMVAQFRFDDETMDVKRTTLGSRGTLGPIGYMINYAQTAPEDITATGLFREEIVGRSALAITDSWALLGGIRYDLEDDKVLLGGAGLRYRDDCFMASVLFEQSNIRDEVILPETRVTLNFSLKYLGAYQFRTDSLGVFEDDVEDASP
jgi:LPS-assembly protein